MTNEKGRKAVDGFELTFSSDWIHQLESQQHWIYYWHQANLVWKEVPKSSKLLEIGVGTGFLSNYLKGQGWSVKTLDIDEGKNPDIIGDASTYEFDKVRPDAVLAFEIFEHLPFPLFARTVENIGKSTAQSVIFSIPWAARPIFSLSIKLPKIKEKHFSVLLRRNIVTESNHHWELHSNPKGNEAVAKGGRKGTVSLSAVKSVFESSGFDVELCGMEQRIQFAIARRK